MYYFWAITIHIVCEPSQRRQMGIERGEEPIATLYLFMFHSWPKINPRSIFHTSSCRENCYHVLFSLYTCSPCKPNLWHSGKNLCTVSTPRLMLIWQLELLLLPLNREVLGERWMHPREENYCTKWLTWLSETLIT